MVREDMNQGKEHVGMVREDTEPGSGEWFVKIRTREREVTKQTLCWPRFPTGATVVRCCYEKGAKTFYHSICFFFQTGFYFGTGLALLSEELYRGWVTVFASQKPKEINGYSAQILNHYS